jgi:cytochrome c oxidase subunit 4
MSHDAATIDKHVRTYMIVFGALMVLTVITVAVSYIELTPGPAIALALFIATIKASLVACYFMHLIDERKLIYWVMALTVAFFFFCLLLPVLTESDNLHMPDKWDAPKVHAAGGHGDHHGGDGH